MHLIDSQLCSSVLGGFEEETLCWIEDLKQLALTELDFDEETLEEKILEVAIADMLVDDLAALIG